MTNKKYHHGDLKNALIQAGIEILSKTGSEGLSLRKVAQRAGVSHSAPYAHFADKQALVAAISTEGFRQLYTELDAAVQARADDPRQQLLEGALAYVNFALAHPDTFKIMFASVLEKEKDYPAFVEISSMTFRRVVTVVEACQRAGILRADPSELLAVMLWGQVHGIISLALENQISNTVTERFTTRHIVTFALERMLHDHS